LNYFTPIKKIKNIMKFKLFVLALFFSTPLFSQQIIDGVAGVVGKEMILKSDIENQVLQMEARDIDVPGDIRCYVYEDLLLNTLLVNQAAIDSVDVGFQQIEGELVRRLSMFERQIGDREEMEKYFGKTYEEIKKSMRSVVENQLKAQTMQQQITAGITVTPTEVEQYYKNIPEDSLPLIESEFEIEQIVKTPTAPESERQKALEKLKTFKKQVENEEKDFETLAILYSDDPGSSQKGGELGWIRRGDLVPEFANTAFNLTEPGQISEVVETDFGYHIIRFLERKGEAINVQHILLQPKIPSAQKMQMRKQLDSVAQAIRKGEITFEEAVEKYSDDENSKNNNGLLLNPYTGGSKFESQHLDPATNYVLKRMEIGEISKPFESQDMQGNSELKIIRLKSRTKAHVANIKTDYQRISDMALEKKKEKVLSDWIKEKQKVTFIKIAPEYTGCDFQYDNWIQ